MIPTVTVSADKNRKYSTNPGNSTEDQVFLLSITEVEKYLKTSKKCAPTDYAIAQGASTSDSVKTDGRATGWWWLRSPGDLSYNASIVNYYGAVSDYGHVVYFGAFYAVRPALWINLGS